MTVIAVGIMVKHALAAAEQLAEDDISVEVDRSAHVSAAG